MGIYIYHKDNGYSASYNAFNLLRKRVCATMGLDWEIMTGNALKDPDKKSEAYKAAWSHAAGHVVYPLLNHSDCSGWWGHRQCENIAGGLDELMKHWPNDRTKEVGLGIKCICEEASKKKCRVRIS